MKKSEFFIIAVFLLKTAKNKLSRFLESAYFALVATAGFESTTFGL